MTDDKNPGSLWQPVSSAPGSSAKVTDVTPEPASATIKSSSSTVSANNAAPASSPASSSPASSSPASSSPAAATAPPSTPARGSALPPKPPSDSVPPPSQPPRRGGFAAGLLSALAIVALAVGALYVSAPHWLPLLMSRGGVSGVPAPVASAPTTPAGMSEAERQRIDSQFAALAAQLAALKNNAGDPALGEQLKKLQSQLEQLSKEQLQLTDMVTHGTPGADPAKPAAPDPALTQRLDSLQKQLETLSAAAAATKSLRGEIDALHGELGKANERNGMLEQRLAELDKSRAAQQSLDQRLAELEKTLAAQQNVDRRSIDAARASATLALAARLRGNVEAGRSLTDDLAALKPLAAGDSDLQAALAALDPLANGSDSVAALRQSFGPVARAIVTAGKSDAADDWVDRAVARLSSIVSVRRVGEISGDTVEAHVARAEVALNNNRLDLAVAELKTLTGTAGQAAHAWLAKAERQLAAMAAADKLQALAAQRLAAIQQAR